MIVNATIRSKVSATLIPFASAALCGSVAIYMSPMGPRWTVMWGLAAALFFFAKAATLAAAPPSIARNLQRRCLAYAFFWVGMDAPAFLTEPQGIAGKDRIAPAIAKLAAGLFLLMVVAPEFRANEIVAGWLGLFGMVLLLHFGLFHLLAVLWQHQGLSVEPIMKKPLCARSLAEFWGERWNRAFNELMWRFVFRPVFRSRGPVAATIAVFVMSGLIHELVISVPAQAGYGGPTIYFLVQALGMLLQRSRAARRLGLHRGWKGWLLTFAFTVLPLPLLFHPPFIKTVIVPFMEAIGISGGPV